MYRNFRTYRHFLNAKLHALSTVICGDDTVLDSELEFRNKKSVTELTEKEAKDLYKEFLALAKKCVINTDKLKEITGDKRSTPNQHMAIIKIARWNLKWKDESICGYILDTFPDLRKKMLEYEIANAKVYRFLYALDIKMADKIIKRLDSIQKRNRGKE